MFFAQLSARGHELSFFQASAKDLKLKVYGEFIYDNIVFFAPNEEKFSSVSIEDFVEFTNAGGNMIFGLNREASEAVRDLVESFGVTLDRKGSEAIDHFDYIKS